jgi:flavin-binding protein dodecin
MGATAAEVEVVQHVYKVVEIVGSSATSIEDAIQTGINRAAKSIRHIGWFEVIQTRGHVENGQIAHFQVTMKVGFTLEGGSGEGS